MLTRNHRVFDSEAAYQSAFEDEMVSRGWEIQAHSDKNVNYIPDTSFSANGTGGWIEIKYCHSEPKRLGDIKHYTKGQELWLRRHGEKGTGYCYLLVGMPMSHLLVRWDVLREARDMPLQILKDKAGGVAEFPTLEEMCYFLNRHISAR